MLTPQLPHIAYLSAYHGRHLVSDKSLLNQYQRPFYRVVRHSLYNISTWNIPTPDTIVIHHDNHYIIHIIPYVRGDWGTLKIMQWPHPLISTRDRRFRHICISLLYWKYSLIVCIVLPSVSCSTDHEVIFITGNCICLEWFRPDSFICADGFEVSMWFRVESVALPYLLYSAQWASYQIRQIAVCACVGNTGNVFPATDYIGNR